MGWSWSTIVSTENQPIQRVPTASSNGTSDLPPDEKAALLTKGVWLVYQQITKLAGVVGQTDKVKI
jgi:hypothetical protein